MTGLAEELDPDRFDADFDRMFGTEEGDDDEPLLTDKECERLESESARH